MTSPVVRPNSRPRPCTIEDARARLRVAEAFADAAHAVEDPDDVASSAASAAIAAADAVCCVALRERPADGSELSAVEFLARVDRKLSAVLKRALDRRAQAAYESRDISASDARMCLRQAELLLEAARDRVFSA